MSENAIRISICQFYALYTILYIIIEIIFNHANRIRECYKEIMYINR